MLNREKAQDVASIYATPKCNVAESFDTLASLSRHLPFCPYSGRAGRKQQLMRKCHGRSHLIWDSNREASYNSRRRVN
eukprot:51626-Rhodomonas_salina.2